MIHKRIRSETSKYSMRRGFQDLYIGEIGLGVPNSLTLSLALPRRGHPGPLSLSPLVSLIDCRGFLLNRYPTIFFKKLFTRGL